MSDAHNITDAAREAAAEIYEKFDPACAPYDPKLEGIIQHAIDAATAELRVELQNADNRAGRYYAGELAIKDREIAELKNALDVGQANCDDAYNDLRRERDIAQAQRQLAIEERDRLRAEVERLTRQNKTFRAAQKACEDCDAPTMAEVVQLRAQLAEANAEIERLSAPRTVMVDARIAKLEAQLAEAQDALNTAAKVKESYRERADQQFARAEAAEAQVRTLREAGLCLAAELCTWAPKEMRGEVLAKWDAALAATAPKEDQQ